MKMADSTVTVDVINAAQIQAAVEKVVAFGTPL
jgi:hypothetical protein